MGVVLGGSWRRGVSDVFYLTENPNRRQRGWGGRGVNNFLIKDPNLQNQTNFFGGGEVGGAGCWGRVSKCL